MTNHGDWGVPPCGVEKRPLGGFTHKYPKVTVREDNFVAEIVNLRNKGPIGRTRVSIFF